MALKMFNIFVYGTLKKGEPNHHWFTKDEDGYWKFICNAQTSQKYPLIIATKFNIPFLLYTPGTGNYVKGEIYEVDNKVLTNLDYLEKHPSFYVRERDVVESVDEDNNKSIEAWIYFMKNFKPKLLEQPFFENYSSNGDHGLKFATKFEPEYDYKSEILL